MKRLTLVRHASAEAGKQDFDRFLTRRGREDAEALAQRLLARGLIPDLLLASPAQRTMQTVQILARRLGLAADALQFEKRLYLARAPDILQIARAVGQQASHLMMVGHNPGLSELLTHLVADTRCRELSTAGACTATFEAEVWTTVQSGKVLEGWVAL